MPKDKRRRYYVEELEYEVAENDRFVRTDTGANVVLAHVTHEGMALVIDNGRLVVSPFRFLRS